MHKISERAKNLKQSGIRAATVKCIALNGINLGQGVCDIPTPDIIKQQAFQAISENKNLYSAHEGVFELRKAIANKLQQFNKISVNPENEIMVTHGATGAYVCATMTLFNPGDEVILFEPFYGYHKNILELNGVHVKTVSIDLTDFSIDMDELEKVVGPKTRGIVICSPCNPCGKVFTRQELLAIGKIAERHDLYILTDEMYEYITYPGHEHVSFASLENFKERTITMSGFSKTYNMTGWRLGYAAGPAEIIGKMALMQDLLYVCPVTPLQHALIAAFKLPPSYYQQMVAEYLKNRDLVVSTLREIGFKFSVPDGAYYILVDFSHLGFADDEQAMNIILEKAKVATVTGRSFFLSPERGKHYLRICYALHGDAIQEAMNQLKTAQF